MNRAGGLLIGLTAAALASPAGAGAWTRPKGQGLVIVKAEDMRATRGYDPDGVLMNLPAERRDTALGVFAEYGLTDRLTLQLKGDWQSGEDAFVDFEGRGPVELGVTWQAWRRAGTALSLYAGYAHGGEGRNAGYAAPGEGEQDWEVRASAGHSLAEPLGPLKAGSWFEVQAARRMRQGLPDETRVDLTAGVRVAADWTLLTQVYAGQTVGDGARWVSMESSVVRDFGDWSLQAGWRRTVAGRETPEASGPMIAVWRRF